VLASTKMLFAHVGDVVGGLRGPQHHRKSTKSLRSSPLRGGKSREAVASRKDRDSGVARPTSTSLPLV
jgi:hypothetical protein